ncbi:hypothetical protein BpHYR1_024185 [Brachionus plicatilis]|uniref:Uncharacterized protein n=1 Tax=Brachionus plicatilis TaxID=10195 RepID=A0A3M7SLR4_BRAPC|nr:hypothetical protein BpHYR1_024185 [Brachionus plicatilis]
MIVSPSPPSDKKITILHINFIEEQKKSIKIDQTLSAKKSSNIKKTQMNSCTLGGTMWNGTLRTMKHEMSFIEMNVVIMELAIDPLISVFVSLFRANTTLSINSRITLFRIGNDLNVCYSIEECTRSMNAWKKILRTYYFSLKDSNIEKISIAIKAKR